MMTLMMIFDYDDSNIFFDYDNSNDDSYDDNEAFYDNVKVIK